MGTGIQLTPSEQEVNNRGYMEERARKRGTRDVRMMQQSWPWLSGAPRGFGCMYGGRR